MYVWAFKDYRIEIVENLPSRSVDFSFPLATKVKLIVSLQDKRDGKKETSG